MTGKKCDFQTLMKIDLKPCTCLIWSKDIVIDKGNEYWKKTFIYHCIRISSKNCVIALPKPLKSGLWNKTNVYKTISIRKLF